MSAPKAFKISIIIPTWNTAVVTGKCIRTLKKFLPRDFAQIIIVDNGSTDDTEKVMRSTAGIDYIRNGSNLGFSRGNNIGAKIASGEYLLFLNSDMELVDSTLVGMVRFMDNHPDIGIIGPRFLNPDLTPQGSVFPPQTPLNAFREYWLGIPSAFTKYTPDSSHPLPVYHISGGALLIRRTDFDRIGGWDERYFFYFEDHELCRQIHKIGKQIYYYPGCKVVHRHGASGHTVAPSADQWRRAVPSSLIYHGWLEHNLLFLITLSSQKFSRLKNFLLPHKKSAVRQNS